MKISENGILPSHAAQLLFVEVVGMQKNRSIDSIKKGSWPGSSRLRTADAYQVITDRIIALLEAGKIPWRMHWNTPAHLPQNAITKRPYRGINAFVRVACNTHRSG